MNCDDFASRLNDELDGSNSVSAADLVEHRAQCASCRATSDGFRLLADCIGVWRHETPDVDLVPAVVYALGQSADRSPEQPEVTLRQPIIATVRERHNWRRHALAGAAALLIGALLFPLLRRAPIVAPPIAQAPVAHTPIAKIPDVRPDAAVPDGPDIANRHDRAQQPAPQPNADRVPYYDLAQRAAGALGQMTLLVLPNDAGPTRQQDEPPADGQAGWMDDFGRELKPVGRSLGNALDFLWRAGESADG